MFIDSSKLDIIRIKNILISLDNNSLYKLIDDNYSYYIKIINRLIKEDENFLLLSDRLIDRVQNIIDYGRFKKENKSKEIIEDSNNLIISINQMKSYTEDEFFSRVQSYLKADFYLRTLYNSTYNYYFDKNCSRNNEFWLEAFEGACLYDIQLQRSDYKFYESTLSNNFSLFFEKEQEINFISSLNILSHYLPELFTKENIDIYDKILQKIKKSDSFYTKLAKKTQKSLKKLNRL